MKAVNILDIKIIENRGTGAGGANTNKNGKKFENKTSVFELFESNNSILANISEHKITKQLIDTKSNSKSNSKSKSKSKNRFYYEQINPLLSNKIIYLTQSGFKIYFKQMFNIDVYRLPDEAYLIITEQNNNINYHLKILEKKNQNMNGSVEDKLKTGQFTKREYEKMLNLDEKNRKDQKYSFKISYAFCISQFLQEKFQSNHIKYKNMLDIMAEDNIIVLYGDEPDYFDKLFRWILS